MRRNLHADNLHPVISLKHRERVMVKRRTAIATPVVTALLTQFQEIVSPAKPLDIRLSVQLRRISLRGVCGVIMGVII